MSQLQYLKPSQIRVNPVALREVDREKEDFISLRDSIEEVGILSPISVRPGKDAETGEDFYEVIDGLQRFTCCKDLNIDVPCHILTKSDAEVLEAQIIGNIHRVETKPVEYSQQLQRILANNPTMSKIELAGKLAKSPQWLEERLKLHGMHDQVKPLVDSGEIKLANAYALAKLPVDEQPQYIDQAITSSNSEFASVVNARAKELRDAKRQGREAKPQEFVASANLRKWSEIKAEIDNSEVANRVIAETGSTTALDGFKAALAWVSQLDPASVAKARAKYEQREREKAEARDKRNAEREQQRADAAREKHLKAEEAAKAAKAKLES